MKLSAPAAERNRAPILAVLERVLPRPGLVLEIASGSGQHAAAFARALPELVWQPTDVDDAGLASIAAYRDEAGLANLRPPLRLDVTSPTWPIDQAQAIVCINMIHIAPWEACCGLLAGAARVLDDQGVLYLYGPYLVEGVPTAPSNLVFDQSLRSRNPAWGVRRLEAVSAEAARHGLSLRETVEMPANNRSVIFGRE